MTYNKSIQAKHLDNYLILNWLSHQQYPATWFKDENSTSLYKIINLDVPEKVVLSKMRSLIKKSLVDGCYCGCRGNFTITEKGENLITN